MLKLKWLSLGLLHIVIWQEYSGCFNVMMLEWNTIKVHYSVVTVWQFALKKSYKLHLQYLLSLQKIYAVVELSLLFICYRHFLQFSHMLTLKVAFFQEVWFIFLISKSKKILFQKTILSLKFEIPALISKQLIQISSSG